MGGIGFMTFEEAKKIEEEMMNGIIDDIMELFMTMNTNYG